MFHKTSFSNQPIGRLIFRPCFNISSTFYLHNEVNPVSWPLIYFWFQTRSYYQCFTVHSIDCVQFTCAWIIYRHIYIWNGILIRKLPHFMVTKHVLVNVVYDVSKVDRCQVVWEVWWHLNKYLCSLLVKYRSLYHPPSTNCLFCTCLRYFQ